MKAWLIAASISAVVGATLNTPALAGANDFFGSSIGGSPETQQGASNVLNASPAGGGGSSAGNGINTNTPAGDFTSDEKRVQKKFKANVRSAQQLIAKGEAMSKSKDDKAAKKGKILKEIGEKRLAELKANNPFPEIAGREPKKVN